MAIRFSRTLRLPAIVIILAIAAGTIPAQSVARERAAIFDYWPANETTNGVTNIFGFWPSPSGDFSIRFLKSGKDFDFFILAGLNQTSSGEKESVLGYGFRGAAVKWFATQAGELAIIDNQLDNGINELFVLKPQRTPMGTRWALLYRTPEGPTMGGFTMAHCYWRTLKLDPGLGVLKLKASWDFSNSTNHLSPEAKTEAEYQVPLFYGAEEN